MSAPRKVVLYNPRATFYTMPLALLALASALDRRRYTPVVVDARLEREPHTRLVAECRDALALGVTVLTGAPLRDALAATRAVRAACPELPIVWGGWHPSLFPRECVTHEDGLIDVAVVGQGEDTLSEALQRIDGGHSLRGCAGTVYHAASGEVVENPPRPLRDLGAFPAHDYDLVPVERYFALKRKRQLDYVSSQGCRFRCTFCADPSVFKRQWAGLDPARIADEAAYLHRRHAFDELSFQDETFFTQSGRVDAICEAFLLRALPFSWNATLRADQGARMEDGLYAKARRAGLTRVMVGVESGDPDMLAWMKKDASVEQVLVTAERLARHDIGGIFNFIVGFPEEPRAAFEATLALLKRVRALSPRFETPVFYYRPYPGTPIADELRVRGETLPTTLDEWAEFDYVGTRGPWIDAERYQTVERLRFYARHAWGPGGAWHWPLRALARWRCARDNYAFPFERHLVEWLRPPAPVS